VKHEEGVEIRRGRTVVLCFCSLKAALLGGESLRRMAERLDLAHGGVYCSELRFMLLETQLDAVLLPE
jgi:hypothetical protein